jgi:hypothetical protein
VEALRLEESLIIAQALFQVFAGCPKGIATVKLYCRAGRLTMRQVALVQQGGGLVNIRATVVFSHPPSSETLTRYGISHLSQKI